MEQSTIKTMSSQYNFQKDNKKRPDIIRSIVI